MFESPRNSAAATPLLMSRCQSVGGGLGLMGLAAAAAAAAAAAGGVASVTNTTPGAVSNITSGGYSAASSGSGSNINTICPGSSRVSLAGASGEQQLAAAAAAGAPLLPYGSGGGAAAAAAAAQLQLLRRQQLLGGGHLALHNLGPMPGHRTCYYSDSGAQYMAGHGPYDAAAAAGGAGVSVVALQQRTIKCSICGVSGFGWEAVHALLC
jgi:hypothetical protein